jgi:hypothetical protein
MLQSKSNTQRYAHNAPARVPPPTRLNAREIKVAQYQNFEVRSRQFIRDKEAEIAAADPRELPSLNAQLAGLKKMAEGAVKLLTDLGIEVIADDKTPDEMARLNANIQGNRYGHNSEGGSK